MSDRRRAKGSSNANRKNISRKSNPKLFVNDTIDELRKELGMIDKIMPTRQTCHASRAKLKRETMMLIYVRQNSPSLIVSRTA